jgi:transposase
MRTDIFNEVKKHMNSMIKINYKKTAETMGCDPRTVKRFTLETAERRKRITESKLSKYEDIIKDKVENYSVTAVSLYNFLKTKGYSGSYGLLRKYIKDKKIECQKEAIYRFETEAGKQAQVDWKERLSLVNKYIPHSALAKSINSISHRGGLKLLR